MDCPNRRRAPGGGRLAQVPTARMPPSRRPPEAWVPHAGHRVRTCPFLSVTRALTLEKPSKRPHHHTQHKGRGSPGSARPGLKAVTPRVGGPARPAEKAPGPPDRALPSRLPVHLQSLPGPQVRVGRPSANLQKEQGPGTSHRCYPQRNYFSPDDKLRREKTALSGPRTPLSPVRPQNHGPDAGGTDSGTVRQRPDQEHSV